MYFDYYLIKCNFFLAEFKKYLYVTVNEMSENIDNTSVLTKVWFRNMYNTIYTIVI